MKLFTHLDGVPSSGDPVKLDGFDGLDVLPYIRNRLVFADLAVRALVKGNYTCILIDLPYFMNHLKWLECPLDMFPLAGMALFRNKMGDIRGISFAPNDAACAAAFWARKNGAGIRCVDDSDMLNYPRNAIFQPPLKLHDDARAYHMGLDAYFEPAWGQLDEMWDQAPSQTQFFTRYRAQIVAAQLLEVLSRGGKCLLVCEYGLWWMLKKCLRESDPCPTRYFLKWTNMPGLFHLVDPHHAWQCGLLDDYPAVNLDFWEFMNKHAGPQKQQILKRLFDAPGESPLPKWLGKAHALERRLGAILAGSSADGLEIKPAISVRTSIQFIGYLKKLMVAYQSALPLPGKHLFHAAEACAGSRFCGLLSSQLLQYPAADDTPDVSLILKKHGVVQAGKSRIPLPEYEQMISVYTGLPFAGSHTHIGQNSWADEMSARGRVINMRERSKAAQAQLTGIARPKFGVDKYAIEADYRLHARACNRARLMVEQAHRCYLTRRSWGSLKKGVHWKATFTAMVGGERAIYVKCIAAPIGNLVRLDEFTPVIFLLAGDHEINQSVPFSTYDPNLAQRLSDYGEKTSPGSGRAPDAVYSVSGCVTGTEVILDGHIKCDHVSALALLYTKPLMGIERYEVIAAKGERYQCRTTPNTDPVLCGRPNVEKMLGWAVQHARDQVIVAAPKGWRAPTAMMEMARGRRVSIAIVPLSAWRSEFLDRMRRLYFTSLALKKHPDRERIIKPFVE